jgi:TnpA family transposase
MKCRWTGNVGRIWLVPSEACQWHVSDQYSKHYCKVEGVSSDDLMSMRSRVLAWSDERVSSLDGQLRAGKSKHVLCEHRVP